MFGLSPRKQRSRFCIHISFLNSRRHDVGKRRADHCIRRHVLSTDFQRYPFVYFLHFYCRSRNVMKNCREYQYYCISSQHKFLNRFEVIHQPRQFSTNIVTSVYFPVSYTHLDVYKRQLPMVTMS